MFLRMRSHFSLFLFRCLQGVFRHCGDGVRPERHEQDGYQPLGKAVRHQRRCHHHKRIGG